MRENCEINGKKMAYLDIGEGPVLLFGHSFLWDADMWQPQLQELSKSYRCIAPDFWGHGESEGISDSNYSMKQIAKDYLALLDALEIQSCAVIGLSVGGMWGTEMALMAPERVESLIIMDT